MVGAKGNESERRVDKKFRKVNDRIVRKRSAFKPMEKIKNNGKEGISKYKREVLTTHTERLDCRIVIDSVCEEVFMSRELFKNFGCETRDTDLQTELWDRTILPLEQFGRIYTSKSTRIPLLYGHP